MRVVLDTCFLEAARRSSRGASFLIVSHAIERRFTACVSPALFFEYEEVLKRHGQPNEIDRLLDIIASRFELVEVWGRIRPAVLDADDDRVLEAAVFGSASAIVTFNERDFDGIEERFGIAAVQPGIFLRSLRS